MAAERLSMRRLREILRLKFEAGLSQRAIAVSANVAQSTVSDYVSRARRAGVGWPLAPDVDDEAALERRLFPAAPVVGAAERSEPDWVWVHRELRRKHVTRMLLWEEYRAGVPDGLAYSQFCQRYRTWASALPVTMRQEHRAGARLFVDFSGDGLELVDRETGETVVVKLFVAVLGASNYTYVEPVVHEDLPTWIGCHVRAFTYFGGVTEIVVPDNLRSGVTRPDYYDPEINRTYADLAEHYGVAVIPARVRRPRDKAKVEAGVLVASRWILAALRHHRCDSFAELWNGIALLLERLNTRPMRKLKRSRRELFDDLDRLALKPLPSTPYTFAVWTKPKANIDYHVEFEHHYYSVPYGLARQRFELRATEATIEILQRGRRVASHRRSYVPHQATTVAEHMPSSHRAHAEWTPSRIIAWAGTIGAQTAACVAAIMAQRPHPEQGFRAALGVIRLAKRYPHDRLERACARALTYRALSYRSVEAILKNHRDQLNEDPLDAPRPLPRHANIRGSGYYH
ncbi:MAG: IS21 family transposase [Microthrixaceae bacterium]|nr:IS21 family transposase [Microthrixaceae bacterium]